MKTNWYYNCSRNCSRCGSRQVAFTSDDDTTWPAKDGNYYTRLCQQCVKALDNLPRPVTQPDEKK